MYFQFDFHSLLQAQMNPPFLFYNHFYYWQVKQTTSATELHYFFLNGQAKQMVTNCVPLY